MTEIEQKQHDYVISVLADKWMQMGFNVYVNFPDIKKFAIVHKEGGEKIYPDLIITREMNGKEKVEVIIEVEIKISNSLVGKWQKMAKGRSMFILVVPEEEREKAEKIVKENGIKVDSILTYSLKVKKEGT